MTVTFESTTLASPPVNTIVGSDTIGGIDYQRIKVAWGTTGSVVDASTSAAAGFPVQITGQSSGLSVSPSSVISVNQGTSPWVTSVSSSTTVIGSVMPSTQWTVTTIPSSVITVNVSTGSLDALETISISSGTVTLTSGTAALGSVGISSGTVTLTSGALALGSVTVSGSVNLTSGTVTLTSGTAALGTVTTIPTSSALVIGTVINSSSTAVIGSINQGTSPWVTSLTSGALALGSVTVTSGTIASLTSGTVTLTSGALALGTVTLSSGALALGSVALTSGGGTLLVGKVSAPSEMGFYSTGVAVVPVVATVTTSSSFALIFTGAGAATNNRVVAASFSRSSSTEAIYGAQLMTSAAVALSGKIFMSPTPSNTVILPYNQSGWAQTTTTAIYVQSGVMLSTNLSVSVTYIPM